MTIHELILKLFGHYPVTEQTLVDHWKTYSLPRNYQTTLQLEELMKQYAIYGMSSLGDKAIIAGGCYVIISYPPRGEEGDIQLHIREDNLRPVLITDMTEEEDFEKSRVQPKLSYGYIWRAQAEVLSKIAPLTKLLEEKINSNQFKKYEGDQKSWSMIETLLHNKTDPVPQLRKTFKSYEAMEVEQALFAQFPAGSIAIDVLGYVTIVVDISIADGLTDVITKALDGDSESLDLLFKRLETEILTSEDNFIALSGTTPETALISTIGNSI